MEKESFLGIKDLLKPVVKDKAQPQKANASTSNLTKVKLLRDPHAHTHTQQPINQFRLIATGSDGFSFLSFYWNAKRLFYQSIFSIFSLYFCEAPKISLFFSFGLSHNSVWNYSFLYFTITYFTLIFYIWYSPKPSCELCFWIFLFCDVFFFFQTHCTYEKSALFSDFFPLSIH